MKLHFFLHCCTYCCTLDQSREVNKATIPGAGGLSALATLVSSTFHPSVHTELRLHGRFQQRQGLLVLCIQNNSRYLTSPKFRQGDDFLKGETPLTKL